MDVSASIASPEFLDEVVSVGQLLTARDVIDLLSVEWRNCVMGAWFSLLVDDVDVNAAVLEALRTSGGRFTLPPLAVAAVTLTGEQAVPPLQEYQSQDVEFDHGACGFAGAALEYLKVESSLCEVEENDRGEFIQLMQVAKWIRSQRLH